MFLDAHAWHCAGIGAGVTVESTPIVPMVSLGNHWVSETADADSTG